VNIKVLFKTATLSNKKSKSLLIVANLILENESSKALQKGLKALAPQCVVVILVPLNHRKYFLISMLKFAGELSPLIEPPEMKKIFFSCVYCYLFTLSVILIFISESCYTVGKKSIT
jgi:hypothetical protein